MGGLIFVGVVIAYIATCIWAIKLAVARISNVMVRSSLAILIGSFLLPLPWLDGIWGAHNLRQTCLEGANTDISGKVFVPRSVLSESAALPALSKQQAVNWKVLEPYVVKQGEDSAIQVRGTELHRVTDRLVRVSDNKEIARQTFFYYKGGWLKNDALGPGASKCLPSVSLESVLSQVIAPEGGGT